MVLTQKHFIDYAEYGYVIEKFICRGVNWELVDDPVYFDHAEMNSVVIEENETVNKRYLILPIKIENDVIILENNEYTLRDILILVHDFYHNREYSYLDLKKMSENVGTIEECTRMKNNNIEHIHPINLIGDHIYFEGIEVAKDFSGDTQYAIVFGS